VIPFPPPCLVVALGVGPVPAALVAQLDPGRPVGRVPTAEATGTPGRDAPSAMRAAKGPDRPGVRDGAKESSESIGRESLARATLVALDFRDRPLGEVARAIGAGSGKAISDRGEMTKDFSGRPDPGWRERRVTLAAPEPVPFWEAVDRLAEAAQVRYRLAHGGSNGAETTTVLFLGPGAFEGGRAHYTGPFRVGLLGLHEHDDVLFVRGPWVRVYPSGMPGPADATALASAPQDGGPLYAELQVLVEPGLVCRRDGPLRRLEASDEEGRSLLAPAREGRGASPSYVLYEPFQGGISPLLRIPLARAGGPSRRLGLLRGAIPVEVAAVETGPALVIPLKDAAGRTFRGGGVTFVVKEDVVGPDGSVKTALTGRFDGDMDPGVRRASELRLMASQYRVVDAEGRDVHFQSSGSGAGAGEVDVNFTYAPAMSLGTGPPSEFRYHDLRRTAAEITFEFRDVPLP
jgi:hypothetical protein